MPLLKKLKALLQHEDVFAILQENIPCPGEGEYTTFRDGFTYKESELYQSDSKALQICSCHDDFSIVNPEIQTRNTKCWHSFLIGELFMRVWIAIDRHSLSYFDTSIAGQQIWLLKFGSTIRYENILIETKLQGVIHIFHGAISIVIADL